jgi:hypothetical protein
MASTAPDVVTALRRHLDPCLEMLGACMEAASDEAWTASTPPVWEQFYHILFWLDAWLRDWSLPLEYPPFHVKEALELRGSAERTVSRAELRGYLAAVSRRCREHLGGLTAESVMLSTEAFGKQWTPLDRTLGQIRHVQHHVGYLNAALRASGCTPAAWMGFQE